MDTDARVIADLAEFAACAGDWNDLAARATQRHAFLRHEWFQSWLEHLAPAGRLRVVVLREAGRLVAAAPLQISVERRHGLPIKVLGFLQSGVTPRGGLLVADDRHCAPLLAAIDRLPGWTLAEFKAMELAHPTTRRLADLLARRGQAVAESWMSSPYEEIPGSWDAYYATRTGTWRRQFRRVVNRLNQRSDVEVLRLATWEELDRHFAELLAISAASWKGDAGTDMASLNQTAAFYRAFSRRTDGQDRWLVYLLRLGGRPVAFMYLLKEGGHWVALRSDYDEEFSYFMPGVFLHREAIADLAAQPPPRVYDLGGWATTFKLGLARSVRPLCDLTFAAPGPAGRLLLLGKRLLAARSGGHGLELAAVASGTAAPLSDDAGESARGSPPDRG